MRTQLVSLIPAKSSAITTPALANYLSAAGVGCLLRLPMSRKNSSHPRNRRWFSGRHLVGDMKTQASRKPLALDSALAEVLVNGEVELLTTAMKTGYSLAPRSWAKRPAGLTV